MSIKTSSLGTLSFDRVSVIIPAYNAARYIGDTIKSVLEQTYPHYEIIVINDGSPDTGVLEEVLKPFRDQIVYLKQENRGAASARNTGIRSATGALVALLDADDIWMPTYLEEQTNYLSRYPDIDLVYCNARFFGDSIHDGMEYMDLCPSEGPATAGALISHRCHVFNSVTARIEVLRSVGFNETFRSSEDFDCWLRIAAAGHKIGYHRKVLVRYRKHKDSLSANSIKMAEYKIKVLTEALALWPEGSEEHQLIIYAKTQKIAELEIVRGKLSLQNKDILATISHLSVANKYYKSVKISGTILLLHWVPFLVLTIFKMRSLLIAAHRSEKLIQNE